MRVGRRGVKAADGDGGRGEDVRRAARCGRVSARGSGDPARPVQAASRPFKGGLRLKRPTRVALAMRRARVVTCAGALSGLAVRGPAADLPMRETTTLPSSAMLVARAAGTRGEAGR